MQFLAQEYLKHGLLEQGKDPSIHPHIFYASSNIHFWPVLQRQESDEACGLKHYNISSISNRDRF